MSMSCECRPVHIVATGAANLASVMAALERIGARPVLTEDPREVTSASHLVLPGVGAFGSAMRRLGELSLVEPLCRRIAEDRPMLAICLGMQLLFEGSDESPGARGLGLLPGRIRGVAEGSAEARIPHMGWNSVAADAGCEVIGAGAGYFANSYCLLKPPGGVRAARTQYGGVEFISAFERGRLLACQFHPELSGRWGRSLIGRWLLATGAEPTPNVAGASSRERRPC